MIARLVELLLVKLEFSSTLCILCMYFDGDIVSLSHCLLSLCIILFSM